MLYYSSKRICFLKKQEKDINHQKKSEKYLISANKNSVLKTLFPSVFAVHPIQFTILIYLPNKKYIIYIIINN